MASTPPVATPTQTPASSLNVTADQRAEVDNIVKSAEMLLPDLVSLLGELATPTIGGAGAMKQVRNLL